VTDYLIWEVIKRAKSEGFRKLDLGATDAPLGLSEYKAKFDPALEPFWILEKPDRLYTLRYFVFKKWAKRLRGL
jgi:hypothetical protein